MVLLVTLASMVFITPFDNQFRFTLGVTVLSTLLFSFYELPVLSVVLASGVSIVGTRVALSFFLGQDSFFAVFLAHIPALAYYVTFGVLFQLFDIRSVINNFPVAILLLSSTDALGNIIELFFRPALQTVDYEIALASIILIAMARSIIALYAYALLRRYHSFVLDQEQLRRYSELMLMIAKLKTELFYLKKSSQDIESVMERSYWLYNQLKQQERDEEILTPNAGKALEIAREIHEVKKDYTRVITGIENVLNPSEQDQYVNFSELYYNIEQNVCRYLEASGKDISITFHYEEDFLTARHYTIVSLLDNLIMNAIEACGESGNGNIRVIQLRAGEDYMFQVEDDGVGINTEELLLVFKPGYSTKFSPKTGKMSTGLGLCHVKNLTEDLGGTVSVSSIMGKGAKFTVTIPRRNLALEE
jgi:two-component system sensor histidine kinase YcbA